MTPGELRRAIEEPARRVGLDFEPGLVSKILRDVERQPGNLPLLEYALTELWNRRSGGLLRHNAYDASGGFDGAIGTTAERVFQGLSPADQGVALHALTRLVRVAAANEEGTDTRRRVRLGDLGKSARSVDEFVKERLLVTDRDPATNDQLIEVAHEALIRNWDRLRALLNKDRAFLLWRQRLGFYLAEWKRSGQDREVLLSGAVLSEAVLYARARADEINEAEARFIQESQREVLRKTKDQSGWNRKQVTRGALAAVAVLAAMLPVGYYAYSYLHQRWERSDSHQIELILAEAPGLLKSASRDAVVDWVVVQHLNGQGQAATASLERLGGDREDDVLSYVAPALAALGRTDEALAMAGRIRAANERCLALANATVLTARKGLSAEATRLAGEALVAARSVTDEARKGEALAIAAVAAAEAGRPNEAREAAAECTDLRYVPKALAAVALALARAGDDEGALDTANQVSGPSLRSKVLATLAEIFAKRNHLGDAKRAATRAIEAVGKMDDTAIRIYEAAREYSKTRHTLIYVAAKLSRAGQAEAVQGFQCRGCETWKSQALVAEALSRASQAGLASAAASAAIKNAASGSQSLHHRVIALEFVSLVLSAGDLNEAALAAAESINPEESVDKLSKEVNYWRKVDAIASSAPGLARAGRFDDAMRAAARGSDPSTRARAFASVAAALMKAGKEAPSRLAAAEALRSAATDGIPSGSQAVFFFLAKKLARAGLDNEALEAAEKLNSPAKHSDALATIAEALGASGRAAQALAVAGRIDNDPDAKSSLMARLTRTLAAAGDPEASAKAAYQVGPQGTRSEALAVACAAFAEAGRLSEAYRIASDIESEEAHSRALVSVSNCQARLGQFFPARQTAVLCREVSDRLSAYATIVLECRKRSDKSLTHELGSSGIKPTTSPNIMEEMLVGAENGDDPIERHDTQDSSSDYD